MIKKYLIISVFIFSSIQVTFGQERIEHIVQPGESLFRISLKYNKQIARLIRDNSLKNTDEIQVGDTIIVYLPANASYFQTKEKIERQVEKDLKLEQKIIKPSSDTLKKAENKSEKPNESKSVDNLSIPVQNDFFIDDYLDAELSFLKNVHKDVVTRWVILTNTIFLFLTIFMIVTIVISRVIKNLIRKRKIRLYRYFENVITGYLFRSSTDEPNSKYSLTRFEKQEIAKTGFQRSILSKMLVKLHRDFIGDSEEDLKKMFVLHQLDKRLKRKLSSKKWSVKASAIHEIGSMQLTDLAKYIRVFAHDKNEDIRFESLLTLVQLEDEFPLRIVDEFEGKLDTWRQVQLFYALDKLPTAKIDLANRWFNHTEPTIVQFAIRLAVRYNQSSISSELYKLLDHPSERVRLATIKAFADLSVYESIEVLKEKYKTLGSNEKKLIIKVISLLQFEIGNEFFKDVMENEPFPLKLEAAKALYSVPTGIELLEQMKQSSHAEQVKLALHAMDTRL